MLDLHKNLRSKERFIQNRRTKDQIYSSLLQQVSKYTLLQQSALFCQRAEKINKGRQISNSKADSLSLRSAQLSNRRERLKEMLTSEFNQYKLEMARVEENPELRKAGLIARIDKMKKAKEDRRKEFVDKQMDRAFELNSWEYRDIMREREKIETLKGIQEQMCEKQGEMLREYEENLILEEMGKRGLERENKKEAKKTEEHKKMVEMNKNIIEMQMKMRENDKNREKKFESKMNGEIRDVLHEELEREKLRNLQRKEGKKQVFKQVFAENNQLEADRNRRIIREKEQDKNWLNEVLKKEKETIENEMRLKFEEDQKKRNFIANFKGKDDSEEKAIDRITFEDNEKKLKEEQEDWRRREEKRLKLLRETYESRKDALIRKKAQKNEEFNEKMKERQKIDNDIVAGFEKEEQARKAAFYKEKKIKDEILAQSSEKTKLLQRKKELEEMEQSLMKGMKYGEENKLENERKKNMQLMNELRRSYPF